MSRQAEILVIGNEVLQGDVLDTNSHWICVQLAGLGADIQRVTQVRDEPEVIGEVLLGMLERAPAMIVVCGGLGPTDDDLTIAAIADALGREPVFDDDALAMVATTYRRLADEGLVDSPEMSGPRRKMALLPTDALPLANSVGAAPGVLIKEHETTIVCLPGVPAELKAIWAESLPEQLAAIFGQGVFGEWEAMVHCGDESILAPILRPVVEAHPNVYVKSRAKPFHAGQRFRITLSARGQALVGVEALVQAAWHDLATGLDQAGIAVASYEPVR